MSYAYGLQEFRYRFESLLILYYRALCIAQIIPFSKIVGLRGGAYQGVKGESVYVPIEPERVSKTVKLLPRKLTDSELVPLKLKRRLRYRGYYMHQTIRRTAVEKAIKCLMQINKLYRNVMFNRDWHKMDNDEELAL